MTPKKPTPLKARKLNGSSVPSQVVRPASLGLLVILIVAGAIVGAVITYLVSN